MENVLPLDIQTIDDIIFNLTHCEDPRAKKVLELAKANLVIPYNEEIMKGLRSKNGDSNVLPSSEWDAPVLTDFADYPFTYLPTVPEIQAALMADLNNGAHFSFVPWQGSYEQNNQATLNLLANLNNLSFKEPGSITGIVSPSFERLQKEPIDWSSYGNLGRSPMLMAVSPAQQVLDLACYQNYFLSSLVTGLKVWIVYPPRHSNINSLKDEYSTQKGGANLRSAFLNIVDNLEHGLVVIQGPGETVMIPPFWSFLVICTQTSVCGSYSISTAETFVERLFNTDMYLSIARMWPSKEQEQSEIIGIATSIGQHLGKVLENKIPNYKAGEVARQLCANWAGLGENVKLKDTVPSFLMAIENVDAQRRVTEIFLDAWYQFLDKRRKQKPECPVCHVRIDDMEGAGNGCKGQILRGHFMNMHWGPRADE